MESERRGLEGWEEMDGEERKGKGTRRKGGERSERDKEKDGEELELHVLHAFLGTSSVM